MNQFRQRGKKLSPLTVLKILARAKDGEQISGLAKEYEINRATINRWIAQWGEEADFLRQQQPQASAS